MFNVNLFNAKCLENNYTYPDIAKALKIGLPTLKKRLKDGNFRASEIKQAVIIFNLNKDEFIKIFFL